MSEQTVLVVDDEEAIAEAVRARLESEGYRVFVAADGPQAIELHAEHHPDLVVLDLMLPGMDGLEVCKQIQRDGWTPVLMLTAKAEEADKVVGLRGRRRRLPHEAVQPPRARLPGEGDPAPDGAHPVARTDDGPLDRGGMVIDANRRRVTVDGDEVGPHPARVRDPVDPRARPRRRACRATS